MKLEEQIQYLIKQYIESDDTPSDLRKFSSAQNALPILFDMSGSIAIRPNCSFIYNEWDTDNYIEEKNPAWQISALVQGSKKYPILETLLPERTPDSFSCTNCNGTGKAFIEGKYLEQLICGKCLGLGWINSYIKSLKL